MNRMDFEIGIYDRPSVPPLSYLGNVYLIKYNKTKLIMIITALSVLTLFIIFKWNLKCTTETFCKVVLPMIVSIAAVIVLYMQLGKMTELHLDPLQIPTGFYLLGVGTYLEKRGARFVAESGK